jgi:Zn-finger nucleic acid-binding protein
MDCLNCGQEMANNLVQTKDDQISYDICESCGSLWLDAGELDKMAFQVEGSIEYCSKDKAESVSQKIKNCPRCEGLNLDKVFFIGHSDIILDHCKNCGGFWLDGGELDLINKELKSIMPIKGKGFSEFVNNVHLPYWYKRVRQKSSETDFKVDVPPIKGAQLKSETEFQCPVCNSKLSLYEIFGIEIEACSKCKGLFLDKDELRKLKDKSTKGTWNTLRWMDDEVEALEKAKATLSKLQCPKCNKKQFISTHFGDSQIIIDWCSNCKGVWLDQGEFEEILSYLMEKLNQLTSDEVKSKVYEEIKEIWNGPENAISEIMDAKAAISALINITIFEHPKLFNLLDNCSKNIPIN